MNKKRETFPVFVLALNSGLPLEIEKNILIEAGIPSNCFKQVFGSYKGVQEISYVVSDYYQSIVLDLAKQYEQESILVLDEIRDAELWFNDGSRQYLGKLKNLGRTKNVNVKNLEAYTIDPVTDCVYGVEA